jgi:hypothetical protein
VRFGSFEFRMGMVPSLGGWLLLVGCWDVVLRCVLKVNFCSSVVFVLFSD